jgi:hypothetical protein
MGHYALCSGLYKDAVEPLLDFNKIIGDLQNIFQDW